MNSFDSAETFRFAVLSVVKHDYVARAVAAHPRLRPALVADDPDQPHWVHERNARFAEEFGIPYVRDVEQALADCACQIAVVSPEAERHCDLSVRAVSAGLHVVQDKPMSTRLSECDRLVEAIEQSNVKFMMWNRNLLPSLGDARRAIQEGAVGRPYAVHIDFHFSKDAGPPKGSRSVGDPPMNWLDAQIAAHADGSDGGIGREPMGALKVEGIYPLAYLRMLAGADVRWVFARTASHFHQLHADNGVEDLATVTLDMDHGMLATLPIGRIGAASHPEIGEIKIHVLGSEGALVISEARPEVGIYYRGQPATEIRNRRVAEDLDYLLVENFLHAIDTDGDPILDAAAARPICAVVEAALESGRTGSPVDVR